MALSDIQVALEGGLSDEVPHAGGSLLVVIGSDCTQYFGMKTIIPMQPLIFTASASVHKTGT